MQDQLQGETQQTLVATFLIGDSHYGLETTRVQEVVRMGEITPVRHTSEEVLGVMNLRGRIVTILDLGKKLGLGSCKVSSNSRIFIVTMDREHVGLFVDQVAGVVQLEDNALLPPPENILEGHTDFLAGVFQSGKALVALLKLNKVLA